MWLAMVALFLITLGGLALTYTYERTKIPFIFRIAMGHVIGEVLFSLSLFITASIFGFSKTTILFSLSIIVLLSLLFFRDDLRYSLKSDLSGVHKSFKDLEPGLICNAAFYSLLLIAMYFFFRRAMIEGSDGIFTGVGHNVGDLPLHLGIIFAFTDGGEFPPLNPSFTYTKLTYPFMSDLVAASMIKLGASASDALLAQNLYLIFSVILLVEYFTFAQLKSRVMGKVSVLILLFCGGLGFFEFFKDYWNDGRSISEFLWHLEKDYTIRAEGLRWGNSLTTLFITQRSFLLGFPLALILLSHVWKFYSAERTNFRENAWKHVLMGILAGCLPLVHVHTLLVLFVVCAVLFIFSLERYKEWFLFGIAVTVIALPELIWSMTGSATTMRRFIEPFFGWDKGNSNFFIFWLKNLGLFIPLLFVGIFLAFKKENQKLLRFYAPFFICFLIGNTLKLAPWQWDNIKVLIYWFTGSIPFVVMVLFEMWKNWKMRALAALCFVTLIFSGALDVWRVMSGQMSYQLFGADAVKVAEMIKAQTPPKAVFLNAPTYNSAVVLTGRQSLMRYTGHLESYGIDFSQRERDVREIYKGGMSADVLLAKYGINYVIISPEEWGNLDIVNEGYFSKFPLIARSGAYKVYEVSRP
jgi:hypothetical protein